MSAESVKNKAASVPGFFGKIPSKGDFLTRRLPDEFVGPWDAWLQNGIAESKAAMQGEWLPAYLNGPIWRFALSRGLCGGGLWAGVLMPSVDRVGRYFPLTVAVRVEGPDAPFHAVRQMDAWMLAAEDAMLDVLESGEDGLQVFDESLKRLPPVDVGEGRVIVAPPGYGPGPCWKLGIGSVEQVMGNCGLIVDGLFKTHCPSYSIWWTDGAERVPPCMLVYEDLPPAERFVDLLGGAPSAAEPLPVVADAPPVVAVEMAGAIAAVAEDASASGEHAQRGEEADTPEPASIPAEASDEASPEDERTPAAEPDAIAEDAGEEVPPGEADEPPAAAASERQDEQPVVAAAEEDERGETTDDDTSDDAPPAQAPAETLVVAAPAEADDGDGDGAGAGAGAEDTPAEAAPIIPEDDSILDLQPDSGWLIPDDDLEDLAVDTGFEPVTTIPDDEAFADILAEPLPFELGQPLGREPAQDRDADEPADAEAPRGADRAQGGVESEPAEIDNKQS